MRRLFLFIFLFNQVLNIALDVKPNGHKLNKSGLMHKLMDTFNDVSNPSKADINCGLCTVLVDGLQQGIKSNKTDQELFQFVEDFCVNLKIEEPHICKAVVPQFGPEIIFVLTKSKHDVDDICGSLIKGCGNPDNPKTQLWSMTIPGNKPAVKPWPTVANGGQTLRVLHLSDIHIDRLYTPGKESNCTHGGGVANPMCCRPYPDDDLQKPIQIPAGPWGMNENCDIPFQTFANAMKHISETQKLDYIIVTGDMEAHDIWDYTKDKTIANIDNITAVLTSFFPTVPIYQATGNHEGVPMDGMPPHTMEEYDSHSPQWLYNEYAKIWGVHLTQQAISDIQYRASYSVYIQKNLRLISLNTVYCSEWNFFLLLDVVDPDGTLEWLTEQLLDAEQKNEKVHIISHIPAGDDYCLKGWSFNFYDIVNRFEGTIAAMFYGHTHKDDFNVFYENGDPTGRPTHFTWIAPSLTTYSYLNPAYRIYTIDGAYTGSSYTVLEAETYWADVAAANQNGQEPNWQLEYKTKQDYQMTDLSPKSWNELIKRLETDDTLFNKFHTNYYRNPNQAKNCYKEPECRKQFICRVRSARSYDETNFCK
ncbi:unnamed protein product, partial [Mesorhabditis belari]|uniref:Sphingomyelin phosphodiesterase n=1 Tax=Mesorhabditis belari TaxID=2138241 RepID=A0AAF3EEF8_9BILA